MGMHLYFYIDKYHLLSLLERVWSRSNIHVKVD